MEEEKREYPKGINYKINENGVYCVRVKEWNGMTFYTVKLIQKRQDKTEYEFSRNLHFNNCEPPKDGDYIRIISGYENNYANKKDPYNCITTIVVNEWELAKDSAEHRQDAIIEYQSKVEENNNDIVITDDDMPF
jgi:ssDNA-binding replication factor A large subunit